MQLALHISLLDCSSNQLSCHASFSCNPTPGQREIIHFNFKILLKASELDPKTSEIIKKASFSLDVGFGLHPFLKNKVFNLMNRLSLFYSMECKIELE